MKKFTTYDEIENLCEAMIKDFMRRKHYTNSHCVDIEAFVTEYLGIPIVYESFAEPDPGRIGFISDGRRPLWVYRNNTKAQVVFPEGTIVIESFLKRPYELGKRRFTIAHEGAHFVIDKHVPAQSQAAFHSEFDGAMNYSQDMLRQMMSITESFANRAAACFLMPRFLVMRMLKQYNAGNKVIAYDGYVMSQDQKDLIQRIADAMGVKNRPSVTTVLKTPAARRDIPIPELLVTALKEQKQKSTSEYVIADSEGEPLSYSQFHRMWHYIPARSTQERTIYRYINGERIHHTIKPELGERCRTKKSLCYTLDFTTTPHVLRHTYITNLIASGVDPKTVQYLAGHENSKVTMDIYAKVKYNKPWELAKVVNAAFPEPSKEMDSEL